MAIYYRLEHNPIDDDEDTAMAWTIAANFHAKQQVIARLQAVGGELVYCWDT